MARCSYCGENIDGLSFKCHRCTGHYCSKHHLPEDHNCPGLKTFEENQKQWQKVLRNENKLKKNIHKGKVSKSKSYNHEDYEMYRPNRRRNSFKLGTFNLSKFLKKYIYFRIDHKVKPHLYQFLMLFVIGIVLDYVYYGSLSLSYLFVGGLKDWFSVLISTLNGLSGGYDFFYLIINGIFYFYFYRYFIEFLFTTITRLNKRDTWVMLSWFAIILYFANKYIPNLI